MRITKRTNIAVRLLMYCTANPGGLVTKAQIAKCCNASENHLAQVIHQLAQLGFIHTQRGRNGGLELARDASDIKIGDVFRALEAPVPMTECFADVDNTCPLVEACRLRDALVAASEAFYAKLDEVSLDGLVCNNPELLNILAPGPCSEKTRAASTA